MCGLCAGYASACEQKKKIDRSSAIQALKQIADEAISDIDRLFILDELLCSSDAQIRTLVLKSGINSKSEVVRMRALMYRMMEMRNYRIELISSDIQGASGSAEREFIKRNGGHLIYQNKFSDPQNSCVSIYRHDSCDSSGVISIDRLKVIIRYDYLLSELELQPDGTLRGFVKPDGNSMPIPALLDIR
jgi:hypothetical protein